MSGEKITEEEFLKEHSGLIGKVFAICVGGERNNCHIGDIHKTQLDKQKVKGTIDNPIINQIVMKRTTESWEAFRDRCYKAERERIKEELGLE